MRGIRIREAPSTDAELIGTLPVHGTAFALLGPLLNDGYSWYLVQDDTGNEPTYDRGWMAVGTDSDPWVTESLGWGGQFDYLASFDGVGPARQTVEFVAGFMALEWAVLGDDCTFAGQLVSQNGDRVQIGGDAVHGLAHATLDAYWFDDHPELDGPVRILIDARCSWAINVIRYQG